MPIRFLLDEHLRGPTWLAVQRHNVLGGLPLDVARVGDPPDLPLRSADAAVLLWAEREGRILITEDRRTMPVHLAHHIMAGHRSPGVFIVAVGCSIAEFIAHLELVAYAGDPADYADTVTYIP